MSTKPVQTPADSGSAAKNIAVTRKVNKLLDVAPTESLQQLLRYVDNSCPSLSGGTSSSPDLAAARKMLRPTLESHVIELHAKFLAEFKRVHDAYVQFNTTLEAIDDATRDVEGAIRTHREQATELVTAVSDLRAELDEVHEKERRLKEFHERYSLSSEEQTCLQTGDIDHRFLAAVNKVLAIHSSCRTLLTNEHHGAAVDIMETMYLTHLHAIERLAKHLAGVVADVLSFSEPEVSNFLVACMAAVQQRPAHWARLMQDVARVRKTCILRKFYDALTKGTPAIGMKPMEASSHDPVRFFGDVLAWLHQTIAEEQDLVATFFGSSAAAPSTAAAGIALPAASPEVSKADILDQIFEGLCKHLAQRFGEAMATIRKAAAQTSTASATVVLLFKLEGIFSFYSTTSAGLIGPNAALVVTLQDSRLTVLRIFYDGLKGIASKMSAARPPRDLAAPSEAYEALRTLRAMMESMEHSLVPHGEREQVFQPILGAVLDPIPAMVAEAADVLDEASRLVWLANVLCSAQAALVGHGFTAARLKRVTQQLEGATCELQAVLRRALLAKFGFTDRLLSLASATSGTADTDAETSIAAALQQFYSFAASAGTLQLPAVDNLQSVKLREHVAKTVTGDLFDAYTALYEHVCQTSQNPEQYRHLDPRKAKILLDAE